MSDLPSEATEGALVIDDFIDNFGTIPVGVPEHLDEKTLAFIARIQKAANERVREADARAQRAAADAAHETAERIAADFDAIQSGLAEGSGLLMAPGAAAARVRSLVWARARRAE